MRYVVQVGSHLEMTRSEMTRSEMTRSEMTRSGGPGEDVTH
jgi:hypothetical protein